jgi:hypothetical protein
MSALKIVIKKKDCFETHLLDIFKIRDIICTYPRTENIEVEENYSSNSNSKVDPKIEFAHDNYGNLSIDLSKEEARFIVVNECGDEITNTDDPEEMQEAIIICRSNELEGIIEDETETEMPNLPPAA